MNLKRRLNKIKTDTLRSLLISVVGLLLYWGHPEFLDNIDLIAQDVVSVNKGYKQPSNDVAIVSVDEKSISTLGRWPWDRALQAKLIRSIKLAQPKVVGLDIVYSSKQNATVDRLLSNEIAANGDTVIGGYFFRNNGVLEVSKESFDIFKKSRIKAVFGDKIITTNITDSQDNGIETNVMPIQKSFDSLGFFNYIPDADGTLRRIPLIWKSNQQYYPSLALRAVSKFTKKPIVLETLDGNITNIRVGKNQIPTDRNGKMVLDFYEYDELETSKGIPIYSASDVINGSVNDKLKNKIIFLGVTEVGIADVRPTPIHNSYPGVLSHGVATSNILENHYSLKNDLTTLYDVLIILLLPLIMIFLLSFTINLSYSLAIFTGVSSIFIFMSYYLLSQGILISIIYPLLVLIIVFAAHQIWFNLFSQHQLQFLKGAFSSYVASSVVDEIVEHHDKLKLGGVSKEISVFFSDIRGFTSISEALTPTQLVGVLNKYMNAMTHIVMDAGGTLDKYIGDAMMVLYNAPLDLKNHQHAAARSSLQIMKALPAVNKDIEESDFPNIKIQIGIGLHSGEAIVGNMGSDIRFDYTAIGDTVNISARLEGATKMYGIDILISDVFYEKIKDDFYCKEMDRIQLKGKEKWMAVYELMAEKNEDNSHLQIEVDKYTNCIQLYYNQQFEQAVAEIQTFLVKYPHNNAAKMLKDRCLDYIKTPPPADWSGVYVATSK